MVLPKKYLEANGDDVFARKPVGSGPYKFVEQVVGSHIKMTAVDSHWRIGVPKYKNVTFKLVPEETTRIALLRRGEVDVADVSRERVKELEKEGFPVHFRKEEAIVHMWWVLGPDGWVAPMKDKRVREALNLAIDRTEIAQAIFGGRAEPAAIPIGLSWSFTEIGFKVTPEMAYPYDPARAKKLLADAGLAGGFPHDVYAFQLPGFPEGKAFAEAVAGYWEKIGVKTKLIPVDYPGLPQAVGGPQGPRGDGLLQHRQPRLDRHVRAAREAGVHAVEAQRHRQRPRDRRHDRAGHAPDRPGRRSTRSCATSTRACAASTTACRWSTCTRPTPRPRRSASGTPAPSCTTSSSTSSRVREVGDRRGVPGAREYTRLPSMHSPRAYPPPPAELRYLTP